VGFASPLRYGVLRAPPWLSESEFAPSRRGCPSELLAAAGGPGNPRIRAMQDPAAAIRILARLSPDSV